MRIRLITLVFVCLCAFHIAFAQEMTIAVTNDDLDLEQSVGYNGTAPTAPATVETLQMLLGLREVQAAQARWPLEVTTGNPGHFRIAFKRPVALGTIISNNDGPRMQPFQPPLGRYISILKPDAPYPGDVNKDEQWIILPAGKVKTLPPGASTRALRFTEITPNHGWTLVEKYVWSLTPIFLYKERYYNALALGRSRRGGKLGSPETLTMLWDEPKTLAGLVFMPVHATQFQIETLPDTVTDHPLIAANKLWKNLESVNVGSNWRHQFKRPLTTKTLRLLASAWRADRSFPEVLPLVNLGDATLVPTLEMPSLPFSFNYQMPLDGFVAIDILDKDGKRVRHLVAEAARMKGPAQEFWDLRDDNNAPVPPGDYTYKAVARPQLKLTYQMTANNAGQPAWWAPTPGKGGGGWLGDHGAPNCVASFGDKMIMGCSYSEDGNSVIITDLDGNKLWGMTHLSWGFRGPNRTASDGKRFGYAVNDAVIMQIDAENDFARRQVHTFKHTSALPGNTNDYDSLFRKGGVAVRGDKLYYAVNATPESWLKPAFLAEDIDPAKCLPLVYLKQGKGSRSGRGDKNYNESEYDELMRLYAAFLTDFMPDVTPSLSGTAIPSSIQAYFGDAQKDGPLGSNLMVAFKKEIPFGSIVVPDAGVQVYALKEGLDIPDFSKAPPVDVDPMGIDFDFGDEGGFVDAHWVKLTMVGKKGAPGIALAPEGGLRTKALRYKSVRLAYSQVMSRRMADIRADAELVFNEGKATPLGGYELTRATPINATAPALSALVWNTPQALRGVSLTYPNPGTFFVDIWEGGDGEDPRAALRDDRKWREMATIKPIIFNGYFPQSATIRSVDFGKILTVRAVRIRMPVPLKTGANYSAGFQSILAYRHLGGDPPNLPVVLSERITEFKMPDPADEKGVATIVRHIPVPQPNNLAFDADGTLYCVSEGQIITVPLVDGAVSRVVVQRDKLADPTSIATDGKGLLYVSDVGPKVIKVFDVKTGQLVRQLGTPGGQQLGKWDPLRMDLPSQVAVDANGKVWVADFSYQPKRHIRFSPDGKAEKWFLGPVQYGGGGWMDEKNRSFIYYNGMKFVLDWQKMDWRLDSLVFRPNDVKSMHVSMPDRVVYSQGRRFLIGPYIATEDTAVICEERDGYAVPLAAFGRLESWGDVDTRADLQELATLDRSKFGFLWWDKNGDGQPQLAEVQLTEKTVFRNAAVGNDLSLISTGYRIRPTQVPATGAPQYDLEKLEPFAPTLPEGTFSRASWTTEDGRTMVIGNRLFAADGKTMLWDYIDKWAFHEGFYASGYGFNRPAGVLNQEHKVIGHFTLGKEEFFVTNSDPGDWFVFTGDGMFVGCIFGGPTGYGLRRWTMPEWEPGKVDLSDMRLAMEHYQGCVVKADDGKVYAVAGHNHMSVVQVEGFEQMQRFTGSLKVTADHLEQMHAWQLQVAALERARTEDKVSKVPYVENMTINGFLDDWPEELFMIIHDNWRYTSQGSYYTLYSEGALSFNSEYLFATIRSKDGSPMRNAAQDPTMLFKFGDAAEITLAMDEQADPNRGAPVAGDLRILLSMIGGKPTAVLYKPVSPGAPPNLKATFSSPVGQVNMDQVNVIDGAKVVFNTAVGEDWGWAMEVAIPWKSLGVKPPTIGQRLRGDLGVLESDQNGVLTVNRLYWSGKRQTCVTDIPTEARLMPALWGTFYLTEPDTTMHFGPGDVDPFGGPMF